MQTPTWSFEVHYILECLDALTEARQRGGAAGAFALLDLVEACSTQCLGTRVSLAAMELTRRLQLAGLVIQEEVLGQPRLTPSGAQALALLRTLDFGDATGQDAVRIRDLMRKLDSDQPSTAA